MSTDTRIENLLFLRLRIITATDRADVFFPTNGPPEVSRYVAVVDNDLRGNTNPVTLGTSSGTCSYGGADRNFFAGNSCGQASAWQVRIIYSDRSVFQHNLIRENGGAYEAVKYHCAGGSSVICRFNVFSDNTLAKERLNVTGGSAEDQNTVTDSVFERNVVNGEVSMEQPGNLYRHNVAQRFKIAPRAGGPTKSRGNLLVNNC